ncbi:TIGR03862 family flavoprotein [Telmatospirillum sp.]|uniref:TIGR03862 family flavoprotein n=1 Tax=Telmatospirillum sp. TaxID=2079197 RepID=UPI00284C1419|nr:TIGR03862 family flavoprotein [Telmatospirillum sp.]MDR3436887.1 TIGR03862 family flavoprotein [Telmatospirillum sp.]
MGQTDNICIIGGGPAGLMAAEAAATDGGSVTLCDAMPSVGRKFLLAGRGGLNLTHSEPLAEFVRHYGSEAARFETLLADFGPKELQDWAHDLGIETFIGTSGRVFPAEFKAAPLLRAWVRRLRKQGVEICPRHRWVGFADDGSLRFQTADGERRVTAAATIIALGGGSWPQLGSNGAWTDILRSIGCRISPLRPANCGFDVAWSPHMNPHFGRPMKTVALSFGGCIRRGEIMITSYGLEGGAIYALSAVLREAIATDRRAFLSIDLKPDLGEEEVTQRLSRPRGRLSLSNWLRKSLGLPPQAVALLREGTERGRMETPAQLAAAIKKVPIALSAPRPLAEAISSAGGLRFDEVDDNLMILRRPGVFAAGEMLDWEAPTGGYLLTACFATGRRAGCGARAWVREGKNRHSNVS